MVFNYFIYWILCKRVENFHRNSTFRTLLWLIRGDRSPHYIVAGQWLYSICGSISEISVSQICHVLHDVNSIPSRQQPLDHTFEIGARSLSCWLAGDLWLHEIMTCKCPPHSTLSISISNDFQSMQSAIQQHLFHFIARLVENRPPELNLERKLSTNAN